MDSTEVMETEQRQTTCPHCGADTIVYRKPRHFLDIPGWQDWRCPKCSASRNLPVYNFFWLPGYFRNNDDENGPALIHYCTQEQLEEYKATVERWIAHTVIIE